LPSTNREAIRLALRASLAFGCEINRKSAQCRKHYFYPDLPKGYQISQRETPIGINGRFEFVSDGEVKSVGIRQIHIEEDAGKLVHFESGITGVDYNRAGVPLIEIVTEPELFSSSDARAFMEAMRMRLLRAGVSDCKMEQGSLRCDVNVSLRKRGEKKLCERVEMKNINTFSGAERAIEYEIERQTKLLNQGYEISAETRKWDDEKRESRIMRNKETTVDYRFMPEPDIPFYYIDEESISREAKLIPESDVSRRTRYKSAGVSDNDIGILLVDEELSDCLDECIRESANAAECAKLLVGDVSSIISKSGKKLSQTKLRAKHVVGTVELIAKGNINRSSAKKVLQKVINDGGDVKELAANFTSITDNDVIEAVVKEVLAENEKAVYDYKNGKSAAVTYLTGQCMRKLRGRADAEKLKNILVNELEEERAFEK